MISNIQIPADHVIGMEVGGEITKQEIIESVKQLLVSMDQYPHINIYIEMINFEGIEPDAFLEDLRLSFRYMSRFITNVHKMAFVADSTFLRKIAELEYMLIPDIKLKSFSPEEKETARIWVI